MSNPSMETKVKELMELKRMKEEIEIEITAAEDAIKAVMGEEELLLAGSYKVSWKTFTSSRVVDTTALKKALPDVAAAYRKPYTEHLWSLSATRSLRLLLMPAPLRCPSPLACYGYPTLLDNRIPQNHHGAVAERTANE